VYFKPFKPVTEDHLFTGGGASVVINSLIRVVSDKGDGVLLAAPYYIGFDIDLALHNETIPIPVPVSQERYFTMDEVALLERQFEQTEKAGIKIKAVILCNPHNPMGQCYPPEVLIAYAKFCEKYNLHLLGDEIYALSIFPTEEKPKPEPFVSLLSIDWAKHAVNPARIHVAYGMSKDFNANSFRIGALVSQSNPALVSTAMCSAAFSMVSAPAGILWSNVLNDHAFLEEFIKENQKQLAIAYAHTLKWIKFHKIPYIPSNAGHFLLIDLSSVVKDIDRFGKFIPITEEMTLFEREEALVEYFIKNKIFVAPGKTFHTPEGGWLRLTFSVKRDHMNVGLRRLEDALHWPHCPELDNQRIASTESYLSKALHKVWS